MVDIQYYRELVAETDTQAEDLKQLTGKIQMGMDTENYYSDLYMWDKAYIENWVGYFGRMDTVDKQVRSQIQDIELHQVTSSIEP